MTVSEADRSAGELTQFTQVETVSNCINCVLMEKQLHAVMMELKSAQEIISLLNEDIKNNTRGSIDDLQHRLSSRETSESETSRDNLTNGKWTSVVYKRKNNNTKVMCDTNTVNIQKHLLSTNSFASLATLMENQEGTEHVNKCKLPHDTTPTLETVSQRDSGWKIPTIVNGKTSNNVSDKKKPLRRTTQKSTKILHKVEIIGDSHLKGIASKINQYLNTKFKVCSLTKPGAGTNQIVCTQEHELICLGKKDVIVINGGTNDTDKPHIKDTDVLTPMVHFIQKYSNTNIIILDIPYRHDLRKADKTNLCIQSYNSKLKNITKTYQHVSLIEVSSDWRHFTKHGLHLNRYGKEWLAKKITRQIELQIETTAKVNPTITLNGKVEITNSTNGNNLMPTENTVEDNPTITLQQKEE